jgi:lipopolysaccharide/colanic/teichoic acid biosynthesis glycosyltransferase
LDAVRLHDHYWASRGTFVARLGDPLPIPDAAELYLLTDSDSLAVFRLRGLLNTMSWVNPDVLFLRLRHQQDVGYRETVETDSDGSFRRVHRQYGPQVPPITRCALTSSRQIAEYWRRCGVTGRPWRELRRHVADGRREFRRIAGHVYDNRSDVEVSRFVSHLIQCWRDPFRTLPFVRRHAPGVWAGRDLQIDAKTRMVGPIWIGAGRRVLPGGSIAGPAVLWDDPARRPMPSEVAWGSVAPSPAGSSSAPPDSPPSNGHAIRPRRVFGKRAFDIFCSVVVLLLTLPVYPIVMLAIWLEDGRPFFFVHRRETLGGREFPCIKFRSMRKDAEEIKARLRASNRADGPQFYLPGDPRLSLVGRFIRPFNIDELPQFINVLLGQMSVVGPRPSPADENQFCPSWRDARLSVRAGITGLWQVERTRQPGLDFQEWIRYDVQYVQNASWRMDLTIFWKTVRIVLKH